MSVRIDPNLAPTLLEAIEQARQQQSQAIEQLASGRSVNRPADNPTAAAALVLNHVQAAQNDQFQRNIAHFQGLFQVADAALNSAVQLMTRAVQLGTQAANGTLSDADRQAIAAELEGIRQQMIGIANTTYQGEYIFAGTAVSTVPFVADSTTPDGVRYQGNAAQNTIMLLNGETMATNLPGNQIFQNPGGNVFGALNQMMTALQTGSDPSGALQSLQAAFAQLNQQRVFYGNALNQLQSANNFLQQENVQLSMQENDLVGIDPAQAASNLVQAETDANAVLSAAGRILNRPTLFDFLS
jgi:flagellar hook-associated protein 3 FlgL